MALGYSVKLPLTTTVAHYDMINNIYKNVKQNFKNLLLTSPGERVMIPNFGVGIRRYLFENDPSFIADELNSVIREQVNSFMSFLVVEDISFATKADNDQLNDNELAVRIIYSVPGISLRDSIIVAP
jgi:phage baseplate assembly protein W|tara:strand:+ start:4937 stop:5317 length:381 start_codon:yes stop_codon:yes gene_type:complete